MSYNNFTSNNLMKIEWYVDVVKAVRSPNRPEPTILDAILGVFWPIQDTLVVREPLCDV